jgi:hypothetical protein
VADPNRALFESVVRLLAPVLDELVFVGGCTTGLFITDPAARVSVPRETSMRLSMSPPTRSTPRSRNDCARWDSPRTPRLAHRSADGAATI